MALELLMANAKWRRKAVKPSRENEISTIKINNAN